jgi:hypothetical protein
MDSSLTSLITSFPIVIGIVAIAGFVVQRTMRAKTNRRMDEAFRQSQPASSAASIPTPTAAAPAVPAAVGIAPDDGFAAKRARTGIVVLVLAVAVVVARQVYFGRITGDMNETMRLAFDPEAQSTARLVGTGSLLLAGVLGIAGIALLATGRRWRSGSPPMTGPIVLGVGLIAGLFLAYRGLEYSRCRSSCQADCDAEAQRQNPFAGFGVRNDVGRALCASRVSECFASCRFP